MGREGGRGGVMCLHKQANNDCCTCLCRGLSSGLLLRELPAAGAFFRGNVFVLARRVGSNVNSVVAPGSLFGQRENVVFWLCTEPYLFLKRYKYSHIDGCFLYFGFLI